MAREEVAEQDVLVRRLGRTVVLVEVMCFIRDAGESSPRHGVLTAFQCLAKARCGSPQMVWRAKKLLREISLDS